MKIITELRASIEVHLFRSLLPLDGLTNQGSVSFSLANGLSAADIGHQISAVRQHPLLAAQINESPYHIDESTTRDHSMLMLLSPEDRTARFADGSIEYDIDMIILCTGYAYCFPFLVSTDPKGSEQGIHAFRPYQQIFDLKHPALAFVETPEMIVPFPLAEAQAAVVVLVWSGRFDLLSYDEIRKGCEKVIPQQEAGIDLDYMEMYDWSSKAQKLTSSDNPPVGKMPKFWDAEACWIRMAAAEMKKAFNAREEERSKITKFEELGFRYNGN
ncbi:MAG: hypothetical protein Q9214_006097 [Letrouitia sp. 1 TL-2023]